jgi:alkane 1-monooxygenase
VIACSTRIGWARCCIAIGASAWGALNAYAGDECAFASFLGAAHLLIGVPLLDALLGVPTRRDTAVELGNYLQHYGLTQQRHSWECDLLVSNFYLFGSARHSHHHVEPALPLGSLRVQVAPALPLDYFVCNWIVAWLPFQFFAMMDARIEEFNRLHAGDVAKLANEVDFVGVDAKLDMLVA